jgi:hypothetical protein
MVSEDVLLLGLVPVFGWWRLERWAWWCFGSMVWGYSCKSLGLYCIFLFCGVVCNRFRHWLKCHQLLSQKKHAIWKMIQQHAFFVSILMLLFLPELFSLLV